MIVLGTTTAAEGVRDVILGTAALIGACLTLLAALTWLVAPRIRDYLEHLIEERLGSTLRQVEKQVTPNGMSTPEEKAVSTADRLITIERRQHALSHRVDVVNEGLAVMAVERALDKRVWRHVLHQHGIDVPLTAEERDRGETDPR